MNQRRLSPRASVLSFAATTVLATAVALGLFVLLDPRAQAFWAARFGELIAGIRGVFGAP